MKKYLISAFTGIALLFLLIIALSINSEGADYVWTDNTSGNTNWNDQQNWNDGASGYPDDSGDTATFNSTWVSDCIVNSNIIVGTIQVKIDYTGNISQNGGSMVCTSLDIWSVTDWDCNGEDFTAVNRVDLDASGAAFYCGEGVVSIGAAYTGTDYAVRQSRAGTTFNGESSTLTIGLIYSWGATLSSVTTTFSSSRSGGSCVIVGAGSIAHNNGEAIFTMANVQEIFGGPVTWYDLTINNASCTYRPDSGNEKAIIVANDLTITAGTLDTNDQDAHSVSLTVINTANITGTLNCRASVVSLGSLIVNNAGTFIAPTTPYTVTGETALASGGTFTWGGNLTTASFWCNDSIEIGAGKKLTFTSDNGFENSTGIINISGTVGNYCYITGPTNWTLNGSSLNNTYWWVYANITNGYNYGLDRNGTRVFIGDQTTCYPTNRWDNTAPLISPMYITEGYSQNIYENASLMIHALGIDATYLRWFNWTLVEDGVGTVANGSWDGLTNESYEFWWNETIDITAYNTTNYTIYYNASDTHNSATTDKAKESAKEMLCDVGGELVGDKVDKDKIKDKAAVKLYFKKSKVGLPVIYTMEFLGQEESECENTVTWNANHFNFKTLHKIKLKDDQTDVIMRISATETLHWLRNSTYYIHLLINEEYYLDFSDAREQGITIFIIGITNKMITLRLTHPYWGRTVLIDGKEVFTKYAVIDPLSGAINERAITRNLTLTYEAPADVGDGNTEWDDGPYKKSDIGFEEMAVVVVIITVVLVLAIFWDTKGKGFT